MSRHNCYEIQSKRITLHFYREAHPDPYRCDRGLLLWLDSLLRRWASDLGLSRSASGDEL